VRAEQDEPPTAEDLERALSRLHRQFARDGDPSTGTAVVSLHAEHAERLAGTSAARTRLPEPPGSTRTDTLPEVAPGELTVAVVERALVEHGALIVRGLVPEEHRRRLIEDIDRGLDAQIEYVHGSGELTDPSHFHPHPAPPEVAAVRAWAIENGAVMLPDSPSLLVDTLRMLRDTGITELARDFLGAEPVTTMTKSAGRRIAAGTGICWHQDGGFLGIDHVVLNLWTTLTPCGPGRAPGLELVPRRFRDVVPPRPDAQFGWSVGDSLPDGVDWETVDPVLDAGDAIVFDQLLLHRTGRGDGTTAQRYGTETWMFGAGSVPDHEYLPISTSLGSGD
jgi:hypothetical protein